MLGQSGCELGRRDGLKEADERNAGREQCDLVGCRCLHATYDLGITKRRFRGGRDGHALVAYCSSEKNAESPAPLSIAMGVTGGDKALSDVWNHGHTSLKGRALSQDCDAHFGGLALRSVQHNGFLRNAHDLGAMKSTEAARKLRP